MRERLNAQDNFIKGTLTQTPRRALRANTAPYSPCAVTVSLPTMTMTCPALRRVTLPNHTAGPLAVITFAHLCLFWPLILFYPLAPSLIAAKLNVKFRLTNYHYATC